MPGLSKLDNALRWGFIKKVYGILSAQLLLSACVAAGARRARAWRRLGCWPSPLFMQVTESG